MNPRHIHQFSRLNALEEAQQKWQESEWLLDFLRSEGNQLKEPNEHELVQWHQKLQLTQQI